MEDNLNMDCIEHHYNTDEQFFDKQGEILASCSWGI